jgi:hypothetical protein
MMEEIYDCSSFHFVTDSLQGEHGVFNRYFRLIGKIFSRVI